MDTQAEPISIGRNARNDTDVAEMRVAISRHLVYTVGKDEFAASQRDWLYALSTAVRDRLIDRWMDTTRRSYKQDAKRVYYLSMEFLPGRTASGSIRRRQVCPCSG